MPTPYPVPTPYYAQPYGQPPLTNASNQTPLQGGIQPFIGPRPNVLGTSTISPGPTGGNAGKEPPKTTTPVQQQQQQPPGPAGETEQQAWDRAWRDAGNTGQRPEGYHGPAGADGGMPQGPSEADINAIYQPQAEYLNQQQQQLEGQLPSVLAQADADFALLQQELSGNRQKNLGTVQESQISATMRKEDVLAAARRLYDQLRRGYQQRFGGSTSAGQASSEIASAEQQRQMGLTERQYGDTTRQIEQQRQGIETDYQTGNMKLLQGKQQAIAKVQSDFQNQISTIQSNRAMLESAKAQAKLTALENLRNQVFAINQQATQFAQTLEAQRQASLLDVQNYTAKLNMYGQNAAGATGAFGSGTTTTPTSTLQATTPSSNWSSPYTGNKGSQTVKQYDQFGNPVQLPLNNARYAYDQGIGLSQ